MNEITKHLASNAGFFVYDDDPTPDDPNYISWDMSYNDEILVDYTNLLVKECVNIIRCAVDRQIPASEYADMILTHFSDKQ